MDLPLLWMVISNKTLYAAERNREVKMQCWDKKIMREGCLWKEEPERCFSKKGQFRKNIGYFHSENKEQKAKEEKDLDPLETGPTRDS